VEKIHKKTVVVRLPRGETTMIAYAEQGSGKRVCIFLHGLFGSKREFVELIFPHMPKRGWRSIAIDFPGFGKSPGLKRANNVSGYAELLRAFMDTLGIKRAYLYGMSMGGAVALSFGAKHPERVVAIAAQGAPESGREFSIALSWLVHKVRDWSRLGPITFRFFWEGFKELVATNPSLLREVFSGLLSRAEAEMVSDQVRAIGLEDFFDTDAVAAVEAATSLMELDLCPALRAYTVPVLVLDGEAPASRALASTPRIMRLLPPGLGRAYLFKDVGHMATLLRPQEAAQVTLVFFKAVPDQRPR